VKHSIFCKGCVPCDCSISQDVSAGSADTAQAAGLWSPQQGELVLPDAADVIMPQISASAGSIVAAGAPGVAVERGSGYDEHKVQLCVHLMY
jgi:hypothetical protein